MVVNLQTIMIVLMYLSPLTAIGIFAAMKKFLEILKVRQGAIESNLLLEGGQIKTILNKPKSGAIKVSKETTLPFEDKIGKVWRKGSKPVTWYRMKDLKQLDLSESAELGDAQDKQDIGQRLWNDGYLSGFRKAKMEANLIYIVLIAIFAVGVFQLLIFNNTNSVLGIVRSKLGG